jgi:hypothetical protein
MGWADQVTVIIPNDISLKDIVIEVVSGTPPLVTIRQYDKVIHVDLKAARVLAFVLMGMTEKEKRI